MFGSTQFSPTPILTGYPFCHLMPIVTRIFAAYNKIPLHGNLREFLVVDANLEELKRQVPLFQTQLSCFPLFSH